MRGDRIQTNMRHRVACLLAMLAILSSQAVGAGNLSASGHACSPLQHAAAFHFLDSRCAQITPTQCMRPHSMDASATRHGRGVDQPLTAITHRVAWAVALFGAMLRAAAGVGEAAGELWNAVWFDDGIRTVWLTGEYDVEGLDPDRRQAFVDAVRGRLRSDSGSTPWIDMLARDDAWLRTPISELSFFDLESAARRHLPFDGTSQQTALGSGRPPDIRMNPPDAPNIGIFGWDLARTWPEPGPPLHRHVGSNGAASWIASSTAAFTVEVRDSRYQAMIGVALSSLLRHWDTQFMPYDTDSQPSAVRALAIAASAASLSAATALEHWSDAHSDCSPRTILVVVRYADMIVAILHGSLGRFGATQADIHSVAVPRRSILPELPVTSNPAYAPEAVRGAVPYAIHRFVTYAQSHGALWLHAIIDSTALEEAAGISLPAAPQHDEL